MCTWQWTSVVVIMGTWLLIHWYEALAAQASILAVQSSYLQNSDGVLLLICGNFLLVELQCLCQHYAYDYYSCGVCLWQYNHPSVVINITSGGIMVTVTLVFLFRLRCCHILGQSISVHWACCVCLAPPWWRTMSTQSHKETNSRLTVNQEEVAEEREEEEEEEEEEELMVMMRLPPYLWIQVSRMYHCHCVLSELWAIINYTLRVCALFTGDKINHWN